MIDKIIYLILEGLKNILRNKGTSFISSLLLSISIFTISMIIVANDNTQKVLQYFRGKYKIEVFFKDNISDQKATSLVSKIRKISGVRTATLIKKEDALRIFKDQFDEDILKVLGYNPLPVSAVVNLSRTKKGGIKIDQIIRNIKGVGSIEKVIYQGSLIKKIEKNYLRFKNKIPYLVGFMILINVLLIVNTIRLSLVSRKQLINNLKLIGASKTFILTPFIIEGILISIFSFIFVTPLLIGTVEGFNYLVLNFSSFKAQIKLDFTSIMWFYLLVMVITVLSSYRTASSFLKIKS